MQRISGKTTLGFADESPFAVQTLLLGRDSGILRKGPKARGDVRETSEKRLCNLGGIH